MKKITIFLCLSALLTCGQLANAQTDSFSRTFGEKINTLSVSGKANVKIVYDSVNYVLLSSSNAEQLLQSSLTLQDSILSINDQNQSLNFIVHVQKGQIQYIMTTSEANVEWPGDGSLTWSGEANLNTLKSMLLGVTEALDSIMSVYQEERGSSSDGNETSKKSKRKYSIGKRTDFDFYWAFNNWGDKWYNGLMKMDGAYNLRTSFSSYQLAENYAIVMTDHFKLSLGIGYESDIYKFTDPYVAMGANGDLATIGATTLDAESGVAGTRLDDWSTRLVTRYVTMPIMLQYRDIGVLKRFKMSLGVVPGLCFNSRHTGLKHELEQKGRNYQDVDDVSRFMNPYKLDVRMTFQRKGIGFFVQVPTLPLFIDNNQKVFPIKIGFFI